MKAFPIHTLPTQTLPPILTVKTYIVVDIEMWFGGGVVVVVCSWILAEIKVILSLSITHTLYEKSALNTLGT